MKLSNFCITRPVFATVLSLLLILLGVLSALQVQIREYPSIDEPVVTVRTDYTGAAAEIIESQVSKPIEDSVAGIEGVQVVRSVSRAGRSQVTVTFNLNRDPDSAAADVRDRVSRVRGRLPDNVDEPIVSKVEADARPVVWLAFSSPTRPALEVSDIAARLVKPRLQTLPGVADVRIFGDRTYAMRIWLDPQRLAGYGLTPLDVETALRQQNIELPSGRIESAAREFNVISRTDLNTPAEFEAVVVRVVDGYAVRIRDIARVDIAPESQSSVVRFNGNSAVAMGLVKQATANPLVLSSALREQLPQIERDLPDGVSVTIAYDSSVFIDRSIRAVMLTIGEAILFVAGVIFLFLGRIRASLIPLVTIPISLVSGFTVINWLGFSINTLTLLSMVVAIGLVVDDAIVVLENSYRHIERGLKPLQAAFQAIREVGFAVIAMTLTLAAVFAPLVFVPGRLGRLFTEFAITLAGVVIVSGFVALTLSPMMCARLLRDDPPPRWFLATTDRIMNALTRWYVTGLSMVLHLRWLVLAGLLIAIGTTFFVQASIQKELAPREDRGVFMTFIRAPEGSSLQYTSESVRPIEKLALETADVWRIFMIAGNPTPAQGIAFIGLDDWNERDRPVGAVIGEFSRKLGAVPGVFAFPNQPASLGASFRSRPVTLVIQSSDSYDELQETIGPILADFRRSGLMTRVDADLTLNKPEIRVRVDRDKAADAGVAVSAIGRTMETMLGGRSVTTFKQNNEEYNVVLQLDDGARASPQAIDSLFVRGRDGNMVPLSALVRFEESIGARELNHFGQRRAATITANLADGVSQGDVLDYIERVVPQYLPEGYAMAYDGPMQEFTENNRAMLMALAMALAFIYLVLSAQFESFVDPLVIMTTVPAALLGGLVLLKLGGGTLNIYSQIGLITLIGLITKHGILIVEFCNQLRDDGASLRDAVIQASSLRLRPILMTSAATILGAVPLARASGAGAESRVQIGSVIVGGMTIGTVLTLLVVPAIYYVLARPRLPVARPEASAALQSGDD